MSYFLLNSLDCQSKDQHLFLKRIELCAPFLLEQLPVLVAEETVKMKKTMVYDFQGIANYICTYT